MNALNNWLRNDSTALHPSQTIVTTANKCMTPMNKKKDDNTFNMKWWTLDWGRVISGRKRVKTFVSAQKHIYHAYNLKSTDSEQTNTHARVLTWITGKPFQSLYMHALAHTNNNKRRSTDQQKNWADKLPADSPVDIWLRARHLFHILAKLVDTCV